MFSNAIKSKFNCFSSIPYFAKILLQTCYYADLYSYKQSIKIKENVSSFISEYIALKYEEKKSQIFKMSTNVSPPYLSSLVPQSVDHASSCILYSHNLRPVAARTNLYFNSFLPSVIRDWNELPVVARQLDSVCSFKTTSTEILLQSLNIILQAIRNHKSYTHVYEQPVAH